MSGVITAAAIVSTGMQIYSANKQAKAQERAASQAADSARKQASSAEQAQNKANGKRPDVSGIAAANAASATGGSGSTMLTGPMGIDANALQLGRNTLLGQ